jgi:hypothetical protein
VLIADNKSRKELKMTFGNLPIDTGFITRISRAILLIDLPNTFPGPALEKAISSDFGNNTCYRTRQGQDKDKFGGSAAGGKKRGESAYLH